MGTVGSSHDGTHVAFEVQGDGVPALVFIHGLSGGRSDFAGQFSHFAARHLVVAINLPGGGESGRGRQVWTMAAFGADVASVVEHLGLDDVVLIGHSLGGDVAVEVARRLPGKVRGLVWVSSYRSLGSPKSTREAGEWLAPFHTDYAAAAEDLTRRNFGPHANPDLVERTVARMLAKDPTMIVSLLQSKLSNEPELCAGLKETGVSVVSINPDFKSFDRESLEAHGVRVMVMPGVGHFAMLEDPAGFNELLAKAMATFDTPI